MRRCHYEVLGVERDVSDADLKRVYRRLALRWHPDKNPEDLQECTRVFTEIQQAYEVLIDPQERAWYDKHREQILQGGDYYVDNSINLMKFFSPSVFSGYGDDKNGFYTVYSKVFKTLIEEDAEFISGEDKPDILDEIPVFGTSASCYEEVVEPFYAYWQSYCTYKSFVWVEKYDVRQAPNRRTQRLMEKENKKLRDVAKRERNEEVRALVTFVRKRDKRVKAYLELLKEKEKERKRLTEQKRLEAKREREKMFEEYKEQNWASLNGLEEDLDEMNRHLAKEFGDDVSDSQSEDEEVEHFYCVACEKSFKSQKALVNHEKSRKHKENAAFIRREMEKSETVPAEIGEEATEEISENADSEVENKFLRRQLSSFDEDSGGGHSEFVSVGELELMDSMELSTLRIKTTNRYKVKAEKHGKGRSLSGIGEELEGEESDSRDEENGNESAADLESGNGENKRDEQKRQINNEENAESHSDAVPDIQVCAEGKSGGDDSPAKDVKPNIEATPAESRATDDNTTSSQWTCNVCKAQFSSRNKMFHHIKESGHALRVDANDFQEKKTQGKKKGKKRR